jgi:hypothetical protein
MAWLVKCASHGVGIIPNVEQTACHCPFKNVGACAHGIVPLPLLLKLILGQMLNWVTAPSESKERNTQLPSIDCCFASSKAFMALSACWLVVVECYWQAMQQWANKKAKRYFMCGVECPKKASKLM